MPHDEEIEPSEHDHDLICVLDRDQGEYLGCAVLTEDTEDCHPGLLLNGTPFDIDVVYVKAEDLWHLVIGRTHVVLTGKAAGWRFASRLLEFFWFDAGQDNADQNHAAGQDSGQDDDWFWNSNGPLFSVTCDELFKAWKG